MIPRDSEDEDAQLKAKGNNGRHPSGLHLDSNGARGTKNGRPNDTTMVNSSVRCQNRELVDKGRCLPLFVGNTLKEGG